MITAVLAALVSAAGFAVSTSLQHHASGKADSHLARHFFKRLVQQPLWFLGLVMGGVAFALHAVALAHGPLAVVQPIVVSGVVLALPVRAALDRRRWSLIELSWVLLAATGLTAFVVTMHPTVGSHDPKTTVAAWTAAIGLLLASLLTMTARAVRHPHQRALLLGGAAGVLFGLVAGVVKMLASEVDGGWLGALADWPLWVVVVSGIGGVAINQRAYQAAPLSVSMPILNVIDICFAVVFGFLVFGETPAHGPGQIVAEVLGFGLTAFSVWRLTKRVSADAEIGAKSHSQILIGSSPR